MNVLKIFLNTVPQRSRQIHHFVQQAQRSEQYENPQKQLVRLFHSLKSSAIMAGCKDLSILAELAEKIATDPSSLPAISLFADYLDNAASNPDILSSSHPEYNLVLSGLRESPKSDDHNRDSR